MNKIVFQSERIRKEQQYESGIDVASYFRSSDRPRFGAEDDLSPESVEADVVV